MVEQFRVEIEPFEPHPMLRNGHAQTVAGNRLRETQGVIFRRERVDTPDGDFIDLDFAEVETALWDQMGDATPIALMVHGLEGNARSGPAYEIYRHLARRGVRAVGMNLRSCSGEMNRTARLYHAGASDDIAHVIDWLHTRYPGVPKGIVAISLGANMTLKYLGERGETLHGKVGAAVAISPPFDLMAGTIWMEKSWTGRRYNEYLLAPLRAKAVEKVQQLPDIPVDLEAVAASKTLREFDDVFTSVVHGFDGAEDYYRRTSSKNFLSGVRIPTLLLRAVEDPFFDPADIPHEAVEANPNLFGAFPQYGGHVGFIEGLPTRNVSFWAERQAARFLSLVL